MSQNALDFTGMTTAQKFEAAGKFAGVPAQVFDGIWGAESGRGTNMRSPKGAEGHFQIMPETRATWEQRQGRAFNPDDFDDGLTLAALTMQENLAHFKTIPAALKAYNGGWDQSTWGNSETSAYVDRVYQEGGVVSAGASTMLVNSIPRSGNPTASDLMYAQGSGTDNALLEMMWRGDDLGDFAGRIKAARERASKVYLSDIEKGLADKAQNYAAVIGGEAATGMAVAARANFEANAADNARNYIAATATAGARAPVTGESATADTVRAQSASEAREQERQALTVLDKWGANATSSVGATQRVIDKITGDLPQFRPDPEYVQTAKTEEGLSWTEVQMIREAVSAEHEADIREQIAQQRRDTHIIGQLSPMAQVGWAVGAGFSDPGGWAAGFGVGKAFQMARVGSTAYSAAGRPLAALTSAGVEGAVGNMAYGAVIDTVGGVYRTSGDYAMDAAFGIGFGVALGTPGVLWDMRSGKADQTTRDMINSIRDAGRAERESAIAEARSKAGPNASPDEISAAIDGVEEARRQAWRQARLGDVAEEDQLMPRTRVGAQRPNSPEAISPDMIESVVVDARAPKVEEPTAPKTEEPTKTDEVQEAPKVEEPVQLEEVKTEDVVAEPTDAEMDAPKLEVPKTEEPIIEQTVEIKDQAPENLVSEDTVVLGPRPPRDANGNLVRPEQFEIDPRHKIIDTADNGVRYYADQRLVKAWDESVRVNSLVPMFKALTRISTLSPEMRRMSHEFSKIVESSGLRVENGPLVEKYGFSKSTGVGGLYFPREHALYVRYKTPDMMLHEAVHAFSLHQLNQPQNAAHRARLTELLDHVRKEVRRTKVKNLPDWLQYRARRTGSAKGSSPVDNIDELVAYSLTDRDTQALLRSLPAPKDAGTFANAWEWFKELLSQTLGIGKGERSALDAVIEAASAAMGDFQAQALRGEAPRGGSATPSAASPGGNTQLSKVRLKDGTEVEGTFAEDGSFKPVEIAQDVPSVFPNAEARQKFIAERNLDTVAADETTRNMIAEVLARAEQINGRISLDPARLKTIMQKVDFEATSTTLFNSQSPVARAVAALLMENPEGAAGRRSTAAISRAALFEQYMGNITRHTDNAYYKWANSRGMSRLKAAMNDDARVEFNREVQLEMNRRFEGLPMSRDVDPHVRQAADLYDTGYNLMAVEQNHVGVIGAEAIDVNTRGYFAREWNLGLIRNMSVAQRQAFIEALSDQFATVAKFTDSKEFKVRDLAIEYMVRLEQRAVGMQHSTATVNPDDAADILRDALHGLGLSAEQVNRELARYRRGSASHTKNRIDMDYSKTYRSADGTEFRMVDFLNSDMNGMYRRYAGRVAGDVALAKYGVMGDAGAKTLSNAMRVTGATQKELDAFDQFMAEMMGRQFGKGDPLLLQNARALTGLLRLGSSVFPQLGTYIDSMAGLGVVNGFKVAGMANQMRKEVQALARGEKVDNPILGAFEGIGPDFGVAEYRIFGIFDTNEMADIAGKERVGFMTKAIRGAGNAQRIASGHRVLVAAQTRGVADQIVRKSMRYIREYDKLRGDDKALADMGINSEIIRSLGERMDKIAKFNDKGELMSLDPRKLDVDDAEGMRAFVAYRDAVMRGTNQILNREYPGEVGKWAHNGWLRALFQFRTVSMVAQQKAMGRLYHVHGAGKVAAIMIGSMAVAAPIHMARMALRSSLMSENEREEFLAEQMHPLMLGRAVMNYITSVGLLPDLVEAMAGAGAGWADAVGMEIPEYMRPTGGRTANQTDLVGGSFAPSLGVVNDIGKGLMGNVPKLVDSLPGASLPYIQPLIIGAEGAWEDNR